MTLDCAETENKYTIKEIDTADEELKAFLFSLGCYSGEVIFVVSKKKKNLILAIKDAKYNIDIDLAKAIIV
ncbi:FeoA family protein [Eubacterium sp.]|uniref:FeoA family protein n=1 Tax=Eubacterium sp. TaxID=142586 RepID=UPI003F0965D4